MILRPRPVDTFCIQYMYNVIILCLQYFSFNSNSEYAVFRLLPDGTEMEPLHHVAILFDKTQFFQISLTYLAFYVTNNYTS